MERLSDYHGKILRKYVEAVGAEDDGTREDYYSMAVKRFKEVFGPEQPLPEKLSYISLQDISDFLKDRGLRKKADFSDLRAAVGLFYLEQLDDVAGERTYDGSSRRKIVFVN